jgi:hypothetical protein
MDEFDRWFLWYSRNWGDNTRKECLQYIDVIRAAFYARQPTKE